MRLGHVQKRNGFTLIELLVVIAILALLMALTVGVISKVYTYLDETKVVSEVNRLAESCQLFKATFGRYPPGKILLAEQGTVYANISAGAVAPPVGYTAGQFQALANYSTEYLSSIFPGINLAGNVHDWNGNGTPGESGYVILEGQQCLVFFLGGMRYGTNTPIGFSTDKTLPTVQTNGARLGPFYDFDTGRFTTSVFPAYNDPYGTPYAYFAAKYQGMNNYTNYYFPIANSMENDCQSITTTGTVRFVPYFQGSVPTTANWALPTTSFKFMKPDTFQIVSAGKDKQFGTGGQWNQTDPEQSLFLPQALMAAPPFSTAVTQDMLQANYDNITNFTSGRVVPK